MHSWAPPIVLSHPEITQVGEGTTLYEFAWKSAWNVISMPYTITNNIHVLQIIAKHIHDHSSELWQDSNPWDMLIYVLGLMPAR